MKLRVDVLRQKSPTSKPYRQIIELDCENTETTVAALLDTINSSNLKDINLNDIGEIKWDCNCLQKKCGACAMVINGRPRLACDTKVSEFKNGKITLEPLKKFPTVCDLVVDRAPMYENLKKLNVWLEDNSALKPKNTELAYEASRCIQCGCCLEVCPNFSVDASFFGAAAAVPVSRIISELNKTKGYDVLLNYRKNIYNGCGKSLSCMNICPVGIDIENLMVNSNAASVWKRKN